MKKPDEIEFYEECQKACGGQEYVAIRPLEIANSIGIANKRAMKILWKWEDCGWWIGVMSGSSGCFDKSAPETLVQ